MINQSGGQITFTSTSESLAEQSADALVVSVGTDKTLDDAAKAIDEALDGKLQSALSSVGFTGKVGTTSVLPTWGQIAAPRIVVTGIGQADDISIETYRKAWGAAARAARNAGATSIASALPVPSGRLAIRAIVEGVRLGLYTHRAYRSTNAATREVESFTFASVSPEDQDLVESSIGEANKLADGISIARDLVNTPGMDLYPERLAGLAWELAEKHGLEHTIYNRAALEEMGAGAIVAVGQGSAREPRLIHLVYRPEGESRATFGLVGKAITFDTGGVNLKPANGMRDMKIDMAGGAAVIGAMQAIAELKPPFTVHGVIAAAENMPSHSAYRPGDVIRTLSGKTVEVTNTDAEGRLVLADALTFTIRQGAEMLIDLATLTGAAVVALGSEAAALFSTDDILAANVQDAAQYGGELVWRMPLWETYRSNLDSIIADIMNSGTRDGGAIKGALFLKEFTEGKPWVHLDIAGPAWSTKVDGHQIKGGTGFGVSTLVTMIERFSGSQDA